MRLMVSKKSSPKKFSNRKKKSIEKTAPMPSLIFSEATIPRPSPIVNKKATTVNAADENLKLSVPTITQEQNQNSETSFSRYQERDRVARRWMWLGVISFSTIIFFLWGWSLWLKFSLMNWNRGSDFSLVQRAEQNWNQLFSQQTPEQLIIERDRVQLKEALRYIINQNTPTTTASPTTMVSSTSAITTSAATTTKK